MRQSKVPEWGTVVKSARMRLGLSQDKLAFRVGIEQSALSKIERGASRGSAAVVARLVSELELDPVTVAAALGIHSDR